jgi:hypothetical protein
MQIAVPRWFLLLVGAGLLLAVALAAFLPLLVYIALIVGWFAGVMFLFARWSRAKVLPQIEAVHRSGERRPYVAIQYPPWVRKFARTWIVLLAASTVASVILLIVAVIELRLG